MHKIYPIQLVLKSTYWPYYTFNLNIVLFDKKPQQYSNVVTGQKNKFINLK